MSEAVIVAIISGLCVGIPSVIATISSNRKNNNLIQYRIDELSKRVEKHNQVVERVYKLEETNSVQDEKIKELERKVG